MPPSAQIFGPASLDRVLMVDGPLVDTTRSRPLVQSVEGVLEFGDGLTIVDPDGSSLLISLPNGWPGPFGRVTLTNRLGSGLSGGSRTVVGLSWRDDLGGMGAGYAQAFGGELVCGLGDEDDPASAAVGRLLTARGVVWRPIHGGRSADWTMRLVAGSSEERLSIRFRGDAVFPSVGPVDPSVELRVAAGIPNRLAAEALSSPGGRVRLFAPLMGNMVETDAPVSGFAEQIDVLYCGRAAWDALPDREQTAWRVSILVVTEGTDARVRYTAPDGSAGRLRTTSGGAARRPTILAPTWRSVRRWSRPCWRPAGRRGRSSRR